MYNLIFFGSVFIFILVLIKRKRVKEYILHNFGIDIKISYIIYLISILFILIIVGAMVLKPDTKFSKLSNDYKEMMTPAVQRPNPLFDINTYW